MRFCYAKSARQPAWRYSQDINVVDSGLVTSSGGLYLLLPAPTRLGLLRANGVGAGFAQLNAGKKLPGIDTSQRPPVCTTAARMMFCVFSVARHVVNSAICRGICARLVVPFIAAVVEFPEGARVVSHLLDAKAEDLKLGVTVRMEFKTVIEDFQTRCLDCPTNSEETDLFDSPRWSHWSSRQRKPCA